LAVTPHPICHSSNNGIVAGVVMILVIGGGLSLFLWRRGAPGGRVAIFFGIMLAIAGGLLASLILKPDPDFISYAVGDGQLVLGFAWPKKAVSIPLAQLGELRVEHGVVRQRERGGAVRTGDVVWIALRAGSDTYRSCHMASPEHLVAAAKELAAAAAVAPHYYVHCEDGHELVTTDDDVARGGDRWDGEFAPRCAAAR
jgi:hypothetical protein